MGTESSRSARENTSNPILKLWIVFAISITVFGCGYSYATSRLSDDYRTISVPAFKNQSFEPDIQITVTNLLIRELNTDGRLRVVNSSSAADLVLRGAITDFEAHAMSFSTDDNIGQFLITLRARATLEDMHTGKVIWEKERLEGKDFYQTRGGRTREEALVKASEELAETIIRECLDNRW